MIPRLAGALIRRAIMPRSAGAIALETAPDVLGAGFTMLSAPEGTPMLDRLLIGAEDLTLGLGGSLVGRGVGGAAAARLNRGAPMRDMAEAIESSAGVGGMIGGMGGAMFGPRPIYGGMQARMEEEMRRKQEERERGIFEQGLMSAAEGVASSPRVEGLDQLLAGYYGYG